MNPKTLLSSLLLAFAAGIAPQAHATGEETEPLPPQTCQAVRHELDLIAGHLRALRTPRARDTPATDPYVQLALELEPHLGTLHANLPTQAMPRAQASVLLSDMRDALILIRDATRREARQVAVSRVADDQRFYGHLLETRGCPASASTAL